MASISTEEMERRALATTQHLLTGRSKDEALDYAGARIADLEAQCQRVGDMFREYRDANVELTKGRDKLRGLLSIIVKVGLDDEREEIVMDNLLPWLTKAKETLPND